jgi:hypothetical protein
MNFEISPNLKLKDRETLERKINKLVGNNAHVMRVTASICPECISEGYSIKDSKLVAIIYEEDGKVWIVKECPKHGIVKDLYWGDYEMYQKAKRFADPGIEILNPDIEKMEEEVSCPDDCGLCVKHKSHTNLGNIVLTNRCNLSCWYCFFYAKKGESIYEPSLESIREMLRRMKNEQPIGANAVQFTGGEPTLRDDLIEIIKIAKEEGYDHVQFNTNGIEFARNPELVKALKEAGIGVVYMSFDGVSPKTNPKNYWEIPDALDNCRKVGLNVVLVPTLIKSVNDHEIGDMIRFAAGNIDVVRSLNIQPVSLVGMMPRQMRDKQRITIPDVCKKIEEQTDGEIAKDDFFTIPTASVITNFIEAMTGQPKYRLSTHFACGVATYAFKEGDKLIPITRFIDIPGLLEYLKEQTENIQKSRIKKISKAVSGAKLFLNIKKFIDEDKKPKELEIGKIITSAITGGDYNSLAEFHRKSLFIGMMHFMDLYNYDIDRVQKCCVHYATPDGRIIPFCAFNVIPQVFRDKTQKEFSISSGEWEKKNNKKLSNDKYVRKIDEKKKAEIVAFYNKFRQNIRK